MKGIRRILLPIMVVFMVVTGLADPGWCEGEGPAVGATAASEVAFQIQDTVVCLDVVDRNPVGSSDVFAAGTAKVLCFCRVIGAQGGTRITHNWYYKGTLKASVELDVRSDNWRTWSSKTIDPAQTGEWMVEILSGKGRPLESIIFFVQ